MKAAGLTPALNSKGLRRVAARCGVVVAGFDPSPEFKGIKTFRVRQADAQGTV